MPEHATGAILPQPDSRDFVFSPERFGAPPPESLPLAVDLRCGGQPPTLGRPCGPVRDQGQEGSCVGHAVSELAEALYLLKRRRFTRLSPAWVYYRARVIEGDPNDDAGADPRDALDVCLKQGVCTELQDPYRVGGYATPTTAMQARAAAGRKLAAYHACPDPTLAIQALAVNHPVIVTVGVDAAFENTGPDGIIPQASLDANPHPWNHENLLVGFTPDWWIVQNSWGTAWGQSGYYYVPRSRWDYFAFPWTAEV